MYALIKGHHLNFQKVTRKRIFRKSEWIKY